MGNYHNYPLASSRLTNVASLRQGQGCILLLQLPGPSIPASGTILLCKLAFVELDTTHTFPLLRFQLYTHPTPPSAYHDDSQSIYHPSR